MARIADARATTPDENKAILHRWCTEVFNQKKVDVVDELKVPNYADWSRFPGQAPTLESFKGTLRLFFTAFPDFTFSVEDTIAEGDMGLIRGTWRATHGGSFMHLPPTGKRLQGRRIDVFRFADGKMSEHWGTGLELGVLSLMGFTPPGNGAGPEAPGDGAALVERFVHGILRERNPLALDGWLAGPWGDSRKQAWGMLFLLAAFPDAQFTVEHVIAEGDRLAVHSTLTGTHLGAFMGVAPTGKRVAVTKVDMFRVDGGTVVDSWHQWDNVSLLLQIGAIAAPGPPGPEARGA
jgi:predicted ester cyclase